MLVVIARCNLVQIRRLQVVSASINSGRPFDHELRSLWLRFVSLVRAAAAAAAFFASMSLELGRHSGRRCCPPSAAAATAAYHVTLKGPRFCTGHWISRIPSPPKKSISELKTFRLLRNLTPIDLFSFSASKRNEEFQRARYIQAQAAQGLLYQCLLYQAPLFIKAEEQASWAHALPSLCLNNDQFNICNGPRSS